MHIAIDIRCLLTPHRTGVGEYTFELLTEIFAQDTVNEYYLFYNSWKNVDAHMQQWHQPNVHYVVTHWPNKIFNFCIAVLKRPYLDRLIPQSIDLFYSPNFGYISLSPGTRHIITVHDITYHLFPYFFRLRQRLWHWLVRPRTICQNAWKIITPSHNTKQDLINYFKIPSEIISVIYPGVSSTFSQFSALPADIQRVTQQTVRHKYRLPEHFMLYLGTIEPRKNILSIITAFEQTYSLLSTPCSLVIAGAPGWKNKQIFAAIHNSPLKKQIHYIGFVDASDKPALYSLAKLFVYPSFYEGFGFPVLEAMSMGTPVITSHRSSLPEITGDTAFLAHPHTPATIADGMKQLLKNDVLRTTQQKNAHVRASRFSWAVAARQWLALVGH